VTSRLISILFGLCGFGVAPFVGAHDFWLQPAAYWSSPHAPIPFTLQVGHGPFRQRSPIPTRRITRFEIIGPNGKTIDISSDLRIGGAADDGVIDLENRGTHVLVLQTDDRAQTHLPAIRFNDYLEVEGLKPAIEQRARLNRMDADGSERYSRCAKSLVQIGNPDVSSPDHITEPVGLPLEIVPETSPYAAERSAALPVRVIYLGEPLAGARVKLTDLENDASTFEMHETDSSGRATFMMPTSGQWLLNVIWTKPSADGDETDFETVFSSLSFGFPNEARVPGS
jgi:uncharacterized GH25 family protein